MRSRTFSIRCSAHSIITVPAKTLAYGLRPARRPFRPADAQIFRRLLDYPFSLHILAHSFAVNEISTLFFSSGSALFGGKTPGVGYPSQRTHPRNPRARRLNDYTARHALEYSACGGTLGLTSPRMAGPNRKRAGDAESGCHSQRQLEASCFCKLDVPGHDRDGCRAASGAFRYGLISGGRCPSIAGVHRTKGSARSRTIRILYSASWWGTLTGGRHIPPNTRPGRENVCGGHRHGH